MGTIKLTSAQLKDHLKEQVALLMLYCSQFDIGNKIVAKPMATSLRILLHTNAKKGSKVKALLDQLGIRNGRWRNVGSVLHPKNTEFHCNLVGFSISLQATHQENGVVLMDSENNGCVCLPILYGPNDKGLRRTPFSTWWTEPVAYDVNKGIEFSREQIVLSMADRDGGAHVDSEIGENYARFRSGEFLAIRALWGDDAVSLMSDIDASIAFGFGVGPKFSKGKVIPGAAAAAIRTIAHEVLLSLENHAPYAFERRYVWKYAGR